MRCLSKRNVIYFVVLINLILISACSSNPRNVPSQKNNQAHELRISGRSNLTARMVICKAEKWDIQLNIQSDSIHQRNFSILTPTLDSAITLVLKRLYEVPFQLPVSANFVYDKSKYELVEAIPGTQIDTATLRQLLKKSIFKKEERIDLNHDQVYVKPAYDNECEEIKQGYKALEKCLKSEVTISGEGKEFKMDHKVFGPWLRLNQSMRVSIDTAAFLGYLLPKISEVEPPLPDLSKVDLSADTSQLREVMNIPRINVLKEIGVLFQLILAGKKSKRDLEWTNIALLDGFKLGHKEFVEISIDEQKLWLFKNNTLVLETAIVTGDTKKGRDTPKGNYNVKYKARNVVLRGRDYASFVSFWMPFYGGYGLHDANWRRSFGGTIYTRSGSHGCVNMPTKVAPLVFNTVKVGTPVIVR